MQQPHSHFFVAWLIELSFPEWIKYHNITIGVGKAKNQLHSDTADGRQKNPYHYMFQQQKTCMQQLKKNFTDYLSSTTMKSQSNIQSVMKKSKPVTCTEGKNKIVSLSK